MRIIIIIIYACTHNATLTYSAVIIDQDSTYRTILKRAQTPPSDEVPRCHVSRFQRPLKFSIPVT